MKTCFKFSLLILFSIFSAAAYSQASVNIMSINTEWFWDSELPHEGRVAVGPRGNGPTELEVELEAYLIAKIITENNADVVGLVEVENENAVDKIREYLPGENWRTVFVKGRDTYTGQDVALLTRFDVIENTATNYKTADGYKPSKILGVGLDTGTEEIFIIVTHFISKTSSNDAKRLKQADFVRRAAVKMVDSYDKVVIMGDLNDTPESPTLNRLTGLDDDGPDFLQTAADSGEAYTYVHDGNKELIDHILISGGSVQEFRTVDLGPVSDHRAALLRLHQD